MTLLLASAPILLILVLMIGWRWSAARAGAAGYLCGLILAVWRFGATPRLLAYAHMKALLFSIDVLLIIWAAFLLYRVSDEAGAVEIIGKALYRLTPDRSLQAMLLGWVFASFLQGVGGFGVPVAVIAPLLVGLGLPPLPAVIIPSLGHGWAVTFGSMGSSFQALIAASGQPGEHLAAPSALLLGLSCPLSGMFIAHALGGWREVRRLWLPTLVWGATMAGLQYFVATFGLWNLGAFLASLGAVILTPPLLTFVRRLGGKAAPTSSPLAQGSADNPTSLAIPDGLLLLALGGYLILIALTLAAQLIPPLRAFLGQVVLRVHFPEIASAQGYLTPPTTSRAINVFGHTGALLGYTSLLSYLLYRRAGRYRPGAAKRIVMGTLQRVMPSSVSILSMIAMALIMEHVGMTETLARGLAQGAGRFFPWVAPWIGGLGAFMTGSNTNSNVVFGGLQLQTARLLKLSVPLILGAQTAGAAIASVVAPAKVVVGASTAGMAGREGEVMRHLIPYTATLLLAISLATALGQAFF